MSSTRRPRKFGVNDSIENISFTENGKSKLCPIYRAWTNMLNRCFSEECKAKHPTYVDCTTVPEWLYFSKFREWALAQPWEGNELDKDILFPGNKVYSPDFCAYVSRPVNRFLTDHSAGRGEWPLGVSRYVNGKKFLAFCNNPKTGICEYLGGYSSPEQAHEAWRAKKHQHACAYADIQQDARVAAALRARYLPDSEYLKWAC